MRFELSSSGVYYAEHSAKRLEKLGFKFYLDRAPLDTELTHHKAGEILYIEIKSLEDLISFTEKYGPCVIDRDTIEIYDDYRE
jgi:hypothetical protein